MNKNLLLAIAAIVLPYAAQNLEAGTLMPSDVIAEGLFAFDTSGSFVSPGAGYGGEIYSTVGGARDDTVEFEDAAIVGGGDGILYAQLTHHGDGLIGAGDGFGGTISGGAETDIDPEAFRADVDLDNTNPNATPLRFTNLSATQNYRIVMSLDFSHGVEALGPDAGLRSDFDLELDGVRIFNSELISDTLLGNQIDEQAAPGFGGLLTAANTIQFTFDLNPGAIVEVGLDHTLETPLFFDGEVFGEANYFLSVDDVFASAVMPEPTTATFAMFCCALLPFTRRRR